MSASINTFTNDRKFVEDFFQWLEEDEALAEVVTEMSLLWADDYGFALYMAIRTIQNLKVKHTALMALPQDISKEEFLKDEPTAALLLPKFKSEDDLEFATTLFFKALAQYADNQEIVDRYSKNWDVERVVFMDSLIISIAIAELTEFESIPVKVTLDEWIDIAKYYSSPTSSTFVNGVLDKIVAEFKESGRINKSGRGLL
jgi:N utilization substance protein B